jgi:hypothetical protein
VPGHAFLGVALGRSESAPLAYLETSVLGEGVTGDHANIEGDHEYSQKQAMQSILEIVDVQSSRAQGIMPIE